jgi:hypothetical protein
MIPSRTINKKTNATNPTALKTTLSCQSIPPLIELQDSEPIVEVGLFAVFMGVDPWWVKLPSTR